MRLHAVDLSFEQDDAVGQFVLRIGAEVLARQQAGGIATRARTVVVICHETYNRPAGRLLSTGHKARSASVAQMMPIGDRGQGSSMDRRIPAEMTAIGFDAPGGPDVLHAETVPVPAPAAGQLLIRVVWAGVNRPDCIQRAGHYPAPAGASPILGLEVSGEVVAVGEGVDPAHIGRQVCALTPGGGYAEYCAAPAGHCLPVPEGMSLRDAAAIPETLFTVWHNVFQRGMAREGETLLLHGGTSGIGTMATMLAKAFDMTVIVTCGDDEKCAAARQIGADHAINYKSHDYVEQVQAITEGRGADIVLDMVSGDYVARNLKCLAESGRHVTIAVLGGPKADINMAVVMSRRLTLTGSTLRPRSDAFKTALCEEIEQVAWPLFVEGAIKPVMDEAFPLADAAKAHARMEGGDHIGKIVLEVAKDIRHG